MLTDEETATQIAALLQEDDLDQVLELVHAGMSYQQVQEYFDAAGKGPSLAGPILRWHQGGMEPQAVAGFLEEGISEPNAILRDWEATRSIREQIPGLHPKTSAAILRHGLHNLNTNHVRSLHGCLSAGLNIEQATHEFAGTFDIINWPSLESAAAAIKTLLAASRQEPDPGQVKLILCVLAVKAWYAQGQVPADYTKKTDELDKFQALIGLYELAQTKEGSASQQDFVEGPEGHWAKDDPKSAIWGVKLARANEALAGLNPLTLRALARGVLASQGGNYENLEQLAEELQTLAEELDWASEEEHVQAYRTYNLIQRTAYWHSEKLNGNTQAAQTLQTLGELENLLGKEVLRALMLESEYGNDWIPDYASILTWLKDQDIARAEGLGELGWTLPKHRGKISSLLVLERAAQVAQMLAGIDPALAIATAARSIPHFDEGVGLKSSLERAGELAPGSTYEDSIILAEALSQLKVQDDLPEKIKAANPSFDALTLAGLLEQARPLLRSADLYLQKDKDLLDFEARYTSPAGFLARRSAGKAREQATQNLAKLQENARQIQGKLGSETAVSSRTITLRTSGTNQQAIEMVAKIKEAYGEAVMDLQTYVDMPALMSSEFEPMNALLEELVRFEDEVIRGRASLTQAQKVQAAWNAAVAAAREENLAFAPGNIPRSQLLKHVALGLDLKELAEDEGATEEERAQATASAEAIRRKLARLLGGPALFEDKLAIGSSRSISAGPTH